MKRKKIIGFSILAFIIVVGVITALLYPTFSEIRKNLNIWNDHVRANTITSKILNEVENDSSNISDSQLPVDSGFILEGQKVYTRYNNRSFEVKYGEKRMQFNTSLPEPHLIEISRQDIKGDGSLEFFFTLQSRSDNYRKLYVFEESEYPQHPLFSIDTYRIWDKPQKIDCQFFSNPIQVICEGMYEKKPISLTYLYDKAKNVFLRDLQNPYKDVQVKAINLDYDVEIGKPQYYELQDPYGSIFPIPDPKVQFYIEKFGYASFSPELKFLAYFDIRENRFFLYDLERQSVIDSTEKVSDSYRPVSLPSFSPDGKNLVEAFDKRFRMDHRILIIPITSNGFNGTWKEEVAYNSFYSSGDLVDWKERPYILEFKDDHTLKYRKYSGDVLERNLSLEEGHISF